jgi:CHAT domain-containing protein
LLLSGLALAGANHRGDAHDSADDGILTAEEIASLDLSSVECAVLSACDTGLGEIASGEGIYGLRRAFQLAGVRSLVVSLWPVDDETTQSWMSELYRSEFVGGADVAAAVRDASLATLAARRAEDKNVHPYYWCAFVAIGSIGAPRPEATDADSTRIPATGRR